MWNTPEISVPNPLRCVDLLAVNDSAPSTIAWLKSNGVKLTQNSVMLLQGGLTIERTRHVSSPHVMMPFLAKEQKENKRNFGEICGPGRESRNPAGRGGLRYGRLPIVA